jgi:chaperonin GroES
MLKLDSHIKLDEDTIDSPNLCEKFSAGDLARIGEWVWTGYDRDRRSRSKWERRMDAAMDLAMQIQKSKNFPWPNCSNVAFPLITIGTTQFHSRAYPAIISGTDVVRCRVVGDDPGGIKKSRADRISSGMSYQVLEQDQSWEEQHDRLLIQVPIVGCAFIKTYFSASLGHNVSELVQARNLVVDYYAKSIESAARKTHCIPLFRNEIYERVHRGTFRDVLSTAWYQGIPNPQSSEQQAHHDNRVGQTPPMQGDETTPFMGLEQHCSLDLDGDGYAEPYIITIEETSREVLRIVTRFDRLEDIDFTSDGKVITVHPLEYFTKYPFIPAPDGGIYDLGFGVLLGPLNESVNTLINQLIDAGTMATTSGGFLGRGAKIRGGIYTFAPLEWKRVDSTGDDLNKSIYPLPVREPSAVLFNLLGLLVNYTNRVSGATDLMVGENVGQNTPAETGRTMVEQGMKIYNATFKRIWRAMKEEFKKLYVLNAIYLPITSGPGAILLREDYTGNPDDVAPSADPNITSESAQFAQAQLVKQSAMATPGYDIAAVERFFLKSLRVDGIDAIYPGPDKVPPSKHPKIQIEEIKMQGKQMDWQYRQAEFAASLMEEQRLNNAKILDLQAQAVKALADIEGDARDREINALNTAIGILRAHDESLRKRIEIILKGLESEREFESSGMAGVAAASGNAVPEQGALPQEAADAGAMV